LDVVIRAEPLRVRQPDALFISNERLDQVGGEPEHGPLKAAPELVVEILSPSETRKRLISVSMAVHQQVLLQPIQQSEWANRFY
jgi:Uma2 family endonuclease